MRPTIIRLKRYRNPITTVCRFCLMNASSGYTNYGTLGCIFCQKEVDDYICANFNIVRENKWQE